jgi:predicted RNA-binding protein with TRAM domain
VEVGNTYTVKIEDIGKEGDGIARVDGFVVFVSNVQKDQEVKVIITKVLKRFAFAEVAE